MKEVNSGLIKIFVVEVPKDITWYKLIENDLGDFMSKELSLGKKFLQYGKDNSIYYAPDKFYCVQNYDNPEILRKFSELTEDDCKDLVERINYTEREIDVCYKAYHSTELIKQDGGSSELIGFDSPKESFKSLLESEKIDISKEYLIIKV